MLGLPLTPTAVFVLFAVVAIVDRITRWRKRRQKRKAAEKTRMPAYFTPNAFGVTSREYDHVGTPDLRNWLAYWQGVEAGTRHVTPDSEDTIEMASSEIGKLTAELQAREHRGSHPR